MAELALYRKWRSQNFEDLVGQPQLTQTLKNAVSSGKIAHAYLFCGPRGTGKTSAAKILAKALNCEKGPTPTPCNQCANCLGITSGNTLDCIEIDAASNRGIDEIRDLREKVKFAPTQLRTKVYIIDEVHMLTTEAFNALLKTLEEPPPQTVFVLCTTEPHRLLPTVTSRCQRFDLKRIGTKIMEARLRTVCRGEEIEIDSGALALIAEAATGSLRDALSLLDQLRTFCAGRITQEDAAALLGQTSKEILSAMIDFIAQGDLRKLLIYFHEIRQQGVDLAQLVRDLMIEKRRLLLSKVTPEVLLLEPSALASLQEIASRFTPDRLYRSLRILAELRQELRSSPHLELSIEMSFIRLLKAEWEPSLEGLKRRLDVLEDASPAPRRESQAPLVSEPSKAAAAPVVPVEREVSVSLEAIETGWPAFMEGLRVSRHPLFPLLHESKPVKLEGTALTLLFSYPFHANLLEQKKEEVRKILKEKFQVGLSVVGQVEAVDPNSFIREAAEVFPGAVIVGEASST